MPERRIRVSKFVPSTAPKCIYCPKPARYSVTGVDGISTIAWDLCEGCANQIRTAIWLAEKVR